MDKHWFTQSPENILTKILGHSGTSHEVSEVSKELEKDIKIAYYLGNIPVSEKSLKYFLKRETLPADYLAAFLKYLPKIPSGYEEEALSNLKEVLYLPYENLTFLDYQRYNYDGYPFYSIVRKKGEHILDDYLATVVVSSEGLESLIAEILANHVDQVKEYQRNKKVFAYLVGKALEKASGKFSPKQIAEQLKKGLET
jgi:Glu-tRNA(Gln) amidotransferase subunit E-like FAD-binding protein